MFTKAAIIEAAEASGEIFDETHDGVRIGDFFVEAHTNGYLLLRCVRGTFADVTNVHTYMNAEDAIMAAVS